MTEREETAGEPKPMRPEDVPDGLVKAALDAAFPGLPASMSLEQATRRIRAALAAALPLHAQQIRAEQPPLSREYGVSVFYVSTLRALFVIGPDRDEAEARAAELARRPSVVSAAVKRRLVTEEWEEVGSGG